jgi:hypothetical protein
MAIRHIIVFDNNPAALALLQEQYKQRREIDARLGVNSTVRYFMATFAGPNFGTTTIQYEYETMAELESANDARNADDAWNKLNEALFETGFQPTAMLLAAEQTPQ